VNGKISIKFMITTIVVMLVACLVSIVVNPANAWIMHEELDSTEDPAIGYFNEGAGLFDWTLIINTMDHSATANVDCRITIDSESGQAGPEFATAIDSRTVYNNDGTLYWTAVNETIVENATQNDDEGVAIFHLEVDE